MVNIEQPLNDKFRCIMKIHKLTYNPFQENTYVIEDEDKNCVIIDPGCYFREEVTHFKDFIDKNNLKPLALLNTHAHIDHIMGNKMVQETYDIDLYLHKDDLFLLEGAGQSAHLYGLNEFVPSPLPNKWLEDGQTLSFGKINFNVILGPGHAPGHVAFYNEKKGVLINGDILFNGSYGRVDLPGGSFEDLKKTITQRIFALPDETIVYTGHGPDTTIGKERNSNPILY